MKEPTKIETVGDLRAYLAKLIETYGEDMNNLPVVVGWSDADEPFTKITDLSLVESHTSGQYILINF